MFTDRQEENEAAWASIWDAKHMGVHKRKSWVRVTPDTVYVKDIIRILHYLIIYI
jgi:hypothetical protein